MSLPRYWRPPLRTEGDGTKRKAAQRRLAYRTVTLRAKGRCELCSRLQDPLDPHHAFGRGHLPGIPAAVCETPELILGICRPCHDAIHAGGDQDLINKARGLAMARFIVRHDIDLVGGRGDRVDVMRELVQLVGP